MVVHLEVARWADRVVHNGVRPVAVYSSSSGPTIGTVPVSPDNLGGYLMPQTRPISSREPAMALPRPPGPGLDQLLRDNPRLTRADIQHLQDWLAKQPHLPPMADEELVPFLSSNRFSLERSKCCLDRCLTMRTHAPELFSGRDPQLPENRAQLRTFHVAKLPRPSPEGLRVVGMGYEPTEPADFDPQRSLLVTTALMELVAMAEPACPGYVFVLDAAHLSLTHVARLPLQALQKLLTFLQEAAPMHIEAVHIIHVTPLVERAMLLIRPLLSRELQRMLRFHSGDMAALYEALPRALLPREYGGTCGSTADYYQQLVRALDRHRDWLVSLERRLVDESRRPGRAQGAADVFGLEGSFKQLDID